MFLLGVHDAAAYAKPVRRPRLHQQVVLQQRLLTMSTEPSPLCSRCCAAAGHPARRCSWAGCCGWPLVWPLRLSTCTTGEGWGCMAAVVLSVWEHGSKAKTSFVGVSSCHPLGRPKRPTAGMLSRCMSTASRRGIAHGDVYAHNVMASEEGHATLCDYGALYTAGAAGAAAGGGLLLLLGCRWQGVGERCAWAAAGTCAVWQLSLTCVNRCVLQLTVCTFCALPLPPHPGASFPYNKSGPVRFEAMEVRTRLCPCPFQQQQQQQQLGHGLSTAGSEIVQPPVAGAHGAGVCGWHCLHASFAPCSTRAQVRAFGLMLADMVQRLDISFHGEHRLLGMSGVRGRLLKAYRIRWGCMPPDAAQACRAACKQPLLPLPVQSATSAVSHPTAHPPPCLRPGMERLLELQRELLGVVQLCTAPSPLSRPTFGAVGRRLKAIRKQAARAGLAEVSPRGPGSETASLASLTPRTCVTEAAFSPRSPLSKAAAC